MDERVALVRCDGYARPGPEEAVARAFDLLGGPGAVVEPGQSVFVKTNAGIVTNPEIVRATVMSLQEVTDRVIIGDSPGGPFSRPFLKRIYEKTGLASVARDTGAALAYDTRTVEVPFGEGSSLKRITLCASMLEADRLVSVSKFKSHRFLNVTGPIKNLYGAVPGTTKFVYHSRFTGEAEFADLIVDVHLAAAADFHVMDAVEVLEGDGSRNGTVRRMRAVAAGRSAFALESLAIELVGLQPPDSRVLRAAILRGICGEGTGWFEVLGEAPSSLATEGFLLPSRNFFSERVPAGITGRLARLVAVTPEPGADRCNRCGKCAEVCPRQAITIGGTVALVDRSKCIRCFCCDELCEQQAIAMRRPLLGRLLAGLRS
jgi:uncharacterized protein (DUF362 family)/NAD-dependent dihydropyrimidine dehydrogenase PreA subunit